jgi:hypothetical protein
MDGLKSCLHKGMNWSMSWSDGTFWLLTAKIEAEIAQVLYGYQQNAKGPKRCKTILKGQSNSKKENRSQVGEKLLTFA